MFSKRTKLPTENKSSRPCAICGLAPEIVIRRGTMGRVCLFYGIRITNDEANDPTSELRAQCKLDGNLFHWPVEGVSPHDLLTMVRFKSEWSYERVAARVTLAIAIISIIIAALAYSRSI